MRTKPSLLARRVCALVFVFFSAAALPILLSACNTVEGVGEDVEATGQAIDDAAEDNP
jgi:predicted small secreted protein